MKPRDTTIFEPKVFFGIAANDRPAFELEFAVSEEDGPTLSVLVESLGVRDETIPQGTYHYLIEDPVQLRKLGRALLLLADIAEEYEYDEKPCKTGANEP